MRPPATSCVPACPHPSIHNTHTHTHCPALGLLAGRTHPQRALEELEDASNELMLSDEDTVRFVVGECLVHYDKDTAEERLTGHTERMQARRRGKAGPGRGWAWRCMGGL